jgi:hypothetical protein
MTFDCAGCDESAKKEWGCEEEAEYAIWEDEEDALYNCPAKFIAPCVYDFLSRYDAIKAGWAERLPFDNTTNRFVEAVHIFESELEKAKEKKGTNEK